MLDQMRDPGFGVNHGVKRAKYQAGVLSLPRCAIPGRLFSRAPGPAYVPSPNIHGLPYVLCWLVYGRMMMTMTYVLTRSRAHGRATLKNISVVTGGAGRGATRAVCVLHKKEERKNEKKNEKKTKKTNNRKKTEKNE